MSKAKDTQKPIFIHKGAVVLLLIPYLSWGGITLVGAVENIAMLKVKNTTQKELILRVDDKLDYQRGEIKALGKKIDIVILQLSAKERI